MNLLRRAVQTVQRRAWWVIAFWIAAAVALTLAAPPLSEVGVQDDASFLPDSSPSVEADEVLRQAYPDDPSRDAAYLVFVRDAGLEESDREFIAGLPDRLATIDGVRTVQTAASSPTVGAFLRSPDGAAELVVVELETAPFATKTSASVEDIRDLLDEDAPPGLEHHLTGLPGLAADQAEGLTRSFETTAIASIVLVLLILLLVYRSVVAALVPLATIGLAFLVARGAIATLADGGFEVSSLIETFMVVMIFGAGTDYCLFIVSRYQEELAAGDPVPPTLTRTMVVIAGVIAASAATVIVAFGSLLSAQFGLYRSMGPGLAISIAITLVAGLTLTPAILHVLKAHAFWPRSIEATRQRAEHDHPRWRRIGDAVGRRPAVALLAAAIPLLVASAGLLDMRQSFDLVNDLPPSADAREGFASLDGHLPEGRLSPIFLIVDAPGPVTDDSDFQAIDTLTTALADAPGVGEARSITSPAGGPLTADDLDDLLPGGTDELFADIDPSNPAVAEALQQLGTPEGLRITPALLEAVPAAADVLEPFLLGADRSSPRVVVSLEGNPYSPDALSDFRRLDDIADNALRDTSLADSTIEVAGPTSFYSDIQEVGTRDFRVMSATLVIGIFIVLALLLRSLVAPFYLLATVVLSYTATLGITVFVFRTVLGQEGITFWMPPFLFVILVALGADYNIFVMSRIREEAALGAPAGEAAVRGLVATGRVITSAGLVLAGTFAALIAAPLPNLQQIGFAVTLGVLIDTFVVRTCLVPAITALIGDTAFWPSGGRATTRRGALLQGAAVTLGVLALIAVAGTVIAANR